MPAHSLACLLSFFTGFVSLSQEILWVRLIGFAHGGRPHAFSLVLTAFLIGIAIGALIGRQRCRTSTDLRRDCGTALILAGVVDALCLFAMPAALLTHGASMLFAAILVAATAGAKGVLFPMVHQLGTVAGESRLGKAVSKVYVANVLGSTLGPIVCGFFAMQWFPAATLFALIALLCIGIGLASGFGSAAFGERYRVRSALALVIGVAAAALHPDPLPLIALRSHEASIIDPMVQNRQGVVHLASAKDGGGAFTFGGNIYDGRVNISMNNNSNRLDRVYFLGLLHPAPKRVLVTGLSTGAWTRIIAGFPGVEEIDVVEINPAYVQIIRTLPDIAPILSDPRIRIHIDDGRRWLRAQSGKQYDLIFQNTTYHWRAYSTMLLSRDYFAEVQAHLAPGGVATFNTTDSLDVYHTAQSVFAHALRYHNFVYVSDKPLARRADAETFLRNARAGVVPAFDDNLFAPNAIGHALLHDRLEPVAEYLTRQNSTVAPGVITDMNLLSEFRHGLPNPIPPLRVLLPAARTAKPAR